MRSDTGGAQPWAPVASSRLSRRSRLSRFTSSRLRSCGQTTWARHIVGRRILDRRPQGCAGVDACLDAVAAGEMRLRGRQAAHLRGCLRCQAEVARYRRLRREMRSLVKEQAPLAHGAAATSALAAVLEALESSDSRPAVAGARLLRRFAGFGGMAVATAAGTAGVWVWASRRRPLGV